MDTSTSIMYLAALAGVFLLPGPDMALVIATGAARGAGIALVTALGIAASRAMHVLMSGLGLAALMAAHPGALSLVRWGGAAYLVYLAVKMLRANLQLDTVADVAPKAGASFVRGFLTNLLNPKALLFCSLFLPQFVSAGGASVPMQYLWLGTLLVLTGLFFDALYALLAARITRRMKSKSGMGKYVLPAVFVVLAGRLVAS
ncbi:LysE family translocator [Janthinobacterium fluminis]|uniref:LysE family translocator n=1 Tax=Janthinobacterium fluminis TaxID=2987524 RepID=A0ABT5K145_9BURK|nr:LysE family translocator [Janthinobacterium fluminis]MDC8758400.1 LysE family translocator [Janthinobacterium fluminis]